MKRGEGLVGERGRRILREGMRVKGMGKEE